MGAYIVRRVIASLVTVWLVCTLVFLVFFVMPGGAGRPGPSGITPVAQFFAGRAQGVEVRLRIQEQLGLDEPIPTQYAHFIGRMARGDLGFSYQFRGRVRVWDVISGALRPTVELIVGGSILFIVGGYAMAYVTRRAQNYWSRLGSTMAASLLMSMPHFAWGAFLLVALAAFSREYTLIGAYRPMDEGIGTWIASMWGPWLVLALPFVGFYARLIRASAAEVENDDYIRTSWAKGLRERDVLRHIARSSAIPVVTQFGLNLAFLIGGTIVVEEVFDVPGIGGLLMATTTVGDFPILLGVTVVSAMAIIATSFVIDILYMYIDPRIRLAADRT